VFKRFILNAVFFLFHAFLKAFKKGFDLFLFLKGVLCFF